MKRYEFIKEAETTREIAELILPLVCENEECQRDCGECTEEVVAFLEEDL